MYYVYMLRCSDNSIYTGITNDIKRRINEHFTKNKKCAKYTKVHNVIKIEAVFKTETKSMAAKLEFHIKKLKKHEKEDLILNNNIENYMKEKLDVEKYIRVYN